MFGRKDSMKEFEQMRQALKPTDRRNGGEEGSASKDAATILSQEMQSSMSNITVTPAPPATQTLKRPGSPSTDDYSSIVSTGSIWQGNLKIEGSVRIDGQLSGEIEAKGTVLVSEGAEVNAKVRAAYVIIAGSFQGQVQCGERLEILPTGRVNGELTTKSLVIHEGAFVEGQVRMSVEKAPPSHSHSNGADGKAPAGQLKDALKVTPALLEPSTKSS